MNIKVVRRPRQRGIRMSMKLNGEARLTAPLSASPAMIENFLTEHRAWIEKNLKKFNEIKKQYPPKRFQTGEVFLLLGQKLSLRLENHRRFESRVHIEGCELVCITPVGYDSANRIHKLLHKFYKAQGEKILTTRVETLSKKLGLIPKKLIFRGQKTRWGSCSPGGTVSLNWRLILAPLEVSDYVIVHELTHLKHLNHSKNFWAHVESFCPNYKSHEKWLRDNMYEFDFLGKNSEVHGEE